MDTSECIKLYRKKAGLTQKQLAERTGLSIASIQGYEQGKYNPKIETLSKISRALDIPVESLFGDIRIGLMTESDIEKINYLTSKENDGKTKSLNETKYKKITELFLNSSNLDNEISGKYMKQNRINTLFTSLNDRGQDKALEQIELLTKIPEYQKENNK